MIRLQIFVKTTTYILIGVHKTLNYVRRLLKEGSTIWSQTDQVSIITINLGLMMDKRKDTDPISLLGFKRLYN